MDEKTLLALVEKFGNSDISELHFSEGSLNLVLKKGTEALAAGNTETTATGNQGTTTGQVHLNLVGKSEAGDNTGNAGTAKTNGEVITSPIVGTFYKASSPDAPAFAEVGTRIKKGQTLCILEAMKMMNHLEAEFDCEILAVKAANGDLVEYGQVLFEVRRA